MADSEWTESFSEKHQKKYWKNKSTGETTWKNPLKPAPPPPPPAAKLATKGDAASDTSVAAAATDTASANVQDDWTESFSEKHQKKFWKNKTTGETTWKDPHKSAAPPPPPKPKPPAPSDKQDSSSTSGADQNVKRNSESNSVASAAAAATVTASVQDDWTESFSEKHQKKYWKNKTTGETTWKDPYKDQKDKPAAPPPPPASNSTLASASKPASTTTVSSLDTNSSVNAQRGSKGNSSSNANSVRVVSEDIAGDFSCLVGIELVQSYGAIFVAHTLVVKPSVGQGSLSLNLTNVSSENSSANSIVLDLSTCTDIVVNQNPTEVKLLFALRNGVGGTPSTDVSQVIQQLTGVDIDSTSEQCSIVLRCVTATAAKALGCLLFRRISNSINSRPSKENAKDSNSNSSSSTSDSPVANPPVLTDLTPVSVTTATPQTPAGSAETDYAQALSFMLSARGAQGVGKVADISVGSNERSLSKSLRNRGKHRKDVQGGSDITSSDDDKTTQSRAHLNSHHNDGLTDLVSNSGILVVKIQQCAGGSGVDSDGSHQDSVYGVELKDTSDVIGNDWNSVFYRIDFDRHVLMLFNNGSRSKPYTTLRFADSSASHVNILFPQSPVALLQSKCIEFAVLESDTIGSRPSRLFRFRFSNHLDYIQFLASVSLANAGSVTSNSISGPSDNTSSASTSFDYNRNKLLSRDSYRPSAVSKCLQGAFVDMASRMIMQSVTHSDFYNNNHSNAFSVYGNSSFGHTKAISTATASEDTTSISELSFRNINDRLFCFRKTTAHDEANRSARKTDISISKSGALLTNGSLILGVNSATCSTLSAHLMARLLADIPVQRAINTHSSPKPSGAIFGSSISVSGVSSVKYQPSTVASTAQGASLATTELLYIKYPTDMFKVKMIINRLLIPSNSNSSSTVAHDKWTDVIVIFKNGEIQFIFDNPFHNVSTESDKSGKNTISDIEGKSESNSNSNNHKNEVNNDSTVSQPVVCISISASKFRLQLLSGTSPPATAGGAPQVGLALSISNDDNEFLIKASSNREMIRFITTTIMIHKLYITNNSNDMIQIVSVSKQISRGFHLNPTEDVDGYISPTKSSDHYGRSPSLTAEGGVLTNSLQLSPLRSPSASLTTVEPLRRRLLAECEALERQMAKVNLVNALSLPTKDNSVALSFSKINQTGTTSPSMHYHLLLNRIRQYYVENVNICILYSQLLSAESKAKIKNKREKNNSQPGDGQLGVDNNVAEKPSSMLQGVSSQLSSSAQYQTLATSSRDFNVGMDNSVSGMSEQKSVDKDDDQSDSRSVASSVQDFSVSGVTSSRGNKTTSSRRRSVLLDLVNTAPPPIIEVRGAEEAALNDASGMDGGDLVQPATIAPFSSGNNTSGSNASQPLKPTPTSGGAQTLSHVSDRDGAGSGPFALMLPDRDRRCVSLLLDVLRSDSGGLLVSLMASMSGQDLGFFMKIIVMRLYSWFSINTAISLAAGDGSVRSEGGIGISCSNHGDVALVKILKQIISFEISRYSSLPGSLADGSADSIGSSTTSALICSYNNINYHLLNSPLYKGNQSRSTPKAPPSPSSQSSQLPVVGAGSGMFNLFLDTLIERFDVVCFIRYICDDLLLDTIQRLAHHSTGIQRGGVENKGSVVSSITIACTNFVEPLCSRIENSLQLQTIPNILVYAINLLSDYAESSLSLGKPVAGNVSPVIGKKSMYLMWLLVHRFVSKSMQVALQFVNTISVAQHKSEPSLGFFNNSYYENQTYDSQQLQQTNNVDAIEYFQTVLYVWGTVSQRQTAIPSGSSIGSAAPSYQRASLSIVEVTAIQRAQWALGRTVEAIALAGKEREERDIQASSSIGGDTDSSGKPSKSSLMTTAVHSLHMSAMLPAEVLFLVDKCCVHRTGYITLVASHSSQVGNQRRKNEFVEAINYLKDHNVNQLRLLNESPERVCLLCSDEFINDANAGLAHIKSTSESSNSNSNSLVDDDLISGTISSGDYYYGPPSQGLQGNGGLINGFDFSFFEHELSLIGWTFNTCRVMLKSIYGHEFNFEDGVNGASEGELSTKSAELLTSSTNISAAKYENMIDEVKELRQMLVRKEASVNVIASFMECLAKMSEITLNISSQLKIIKDLRGNKLKSLMNSSLGSSRGLGAGIGTLPDDIYNFGFSVDTARIKQLIKVIKGIPDNFSGSGSLMLSFNDGLVNELASSGYDDSLNENILLSLILQKCQLEAAFEAMLSLTKDKDGEGVATASESSVGDRGGNSSSNGLSTPIVPPPPFPINSGSGARLSNSSVEGAVDGSIETSRERPFNVASKLFSSPQSRSLHLIQGQGNGLGRDGLLQPLQSSGGNVQNQRQQLGNPLQMVIKNLKMSNSNA